MSKLYSLKEVSETYGIGLSMLQKMVLNKQITRVKVGNKNFISKDVIEKYITDNTIEAEHDKA